MISNKQFEEMVLQINSAFKQAELKIEELEARVKQLEQSKAKPTTKGTARGNG